MRNRYPNRRRRAGALAGLLVVALALATGVGSAFSQEAEEEDVPLDTKLFRSFMKELGFRRDGEGIDYRERSPLVVPPSRDLPPPQSEGPAARNPAWPKDPDAARRKQATAAEKAKLKSSAESWVEDSRVLRPNELGPGSSGPAKEEKAGPSGEETGRPMSPSQLGSKNIFESLFSSIGPSKPESAPFTGEPPRTSMTAPPPGYQTPSPNHPYGVDLPKETPKASTLEQRLEPAR